MRYRITLDYIGTDFCGWQVQPGLSSVQGELEIALKKLTGEKSAVTGSGRTDAGVHALSQTAHFDLSREWQCEKIASGLNHFLPPSIRVLSVSAAAPDFHARFDCKQKSYVYLMYRAPERAIYKDRAWAVPRDIDVDAMNDAARRFVGEKDFASFMAGGSDVKSTVRTVTAAEVVERDGLITFETSANGFLYNMVRIMTAVLVSVGVGKLKPSDVDGIIEKCDRSCVKGIAPAYGLYLKSQKY